MTFDSAALRAHLATTVRAWLGSSATEDVPELPDALARRLLRVEEYERSHRDRWGNWEFAYCDSLREGRLWEADVDRWVADRRRELGLRSGDLWPEARPFAVCLTHDVDLVSEAVTPQQALRSMRTSLNGGGASRHETLVRLARPGVRAARALYHGIRRAPAADMLELCVELEHGWGVTASYFFTVNRGASGHRYDCVYDFADACTFRGRRMTVGDVARALDTEGFDIGLHGSYASAVEPGVLLFEKKALERELGSRVTTTRQHFVHWNVRSTPNLQESAGFAADSTLGFNRNLGARAGTSLPFRWFDVEADRPLDLTQVPFLVQDGALFREDALELDDELAEAVIGDAIVRTAATGGLLNLVLHPNNLADPRYLKLFRYTVERALAEGAWFGSIADVNELWRRREAAAGG